MTREERMEKLSNGTPTAVWAYERIRQLEEWIEIEGSRTDICTRNILREVCKTCKCKHKQK